MKKSKVYLDITNIHTLEEYYTKKAITKAIAGIPQTREEINNLIGNITSSIIEELFRGDTVAVYKQGDALIRIPKQAVVKLSDDALQKTEEEPKKKDGFFKRAWKKLTGRK